MGWRVFGKQLTVGQRVVVVGAMLLIVVKVVMMFLLVVVGAMLLVRDVRINVAEIILKANGQDPDPDLGDVPKTKRR